MAGSRAEREKKAYDEDGVWDHAHRWHMRFAHVFSTPNTVRNDILFERRIVEEGRGRRLLEVGCGPGVTAQGLVDAGAGYVLGVDISEKFLGEARARTVPGRLEFAVRDIQRPLEGRFDVIFGRAILHHVDYREVLHRLYADNLNPGGSMHFHEPLGPNLLLRAYYMAVPKAHTPDERPFFPEDLAWLERTFPGFSMIPVNYLSLPLGIASSLLLPGPDNVFTRWGDRADDWIAKNLKFLRSRFRAALFTIRKP